MKISGFIFGLSLYDFWFYDTNDFMSPLPMLMNKKLESKNHQIYSKMLRKVCKKEVSSQFHQDHKEFIFWSTFFMYMVPTFLKVIWWRFFVPCSEPFLISSATLSCKTWNISTFSMLVYYNTNSFFSEKLLTTNSLVCSVHYSAQFIHDFQICLVFGQFPHNHFLYCSGSPSSDLVQ